MLESGVSGKMYRWIQCFLHDRSARVKLDGHLSKSVKVRKGVPQGGVISTTVFLLYINNITTVLPRHVSNTLHADDLAVWSASEHTTSSAYRIQEAVNKVEQWTNDWGLQISKVKTQATVFSFSTSKEKVAIKLGDKTLPQVETPTFLGVKLGTRLSWKPHIEDMEKKGIKKLAVLKKLSGIHWGTNSKILKTVYMGAVRPSLEYGASAWATAAKTHTNKLDKVQNIGLRTILGAMKTTPIAEMEKTAGVEPLEGRRQAKLLIHAEKMKRMQDHPVHQKLKDPTKKQIEKEKSEPPSKRTAEGTRRHPYNRWTPVWKTDFKQLATRNSTCWDHNNHSWHHYKGKPKWSSFEGSGSGRDWQALSSSNLDTHLHRWLSWKCHKERRLWCLHQAPRQASVICVSTWWDTVLKLQSWSPSTAECHRNHHFIGREAQESSLPHRLIISLASPHVWWAWHNAKEVHREHQHPRSNYLCSSSVDTSTHRHSGKWNGRSPRKRRKGKRATPIASVLQRSQNSYP